MNGRKEHETNPNTKEDDSPTGLGRRFVELIRNSSTPELEAYRTLAESIPGVVFFVDHERQLRDWNKSLSQNTGYSDDELAGMSALDLFETDAIQAANRAMQDIIENGQTQVELPIKRKDGSSIPYLFNGRRTEVTGRPCFFVLGLDLSDLKRRRTHLEEQLRQAQKMESVGRLAGGIAHDFNNILFSIVSIADVMLMGDLNQKTARRDLEQIKKAGERAAVLTRQLLAFSRQQVLSLMVVNISDVVRGFAKLLPKLIGEHIELRLSLLQPCMIKADAHQIEQILMNLAVNSRDAMPKGGRLTIKTEPAHLVEGLASRFPDIDLASHIALSMHDSGHGMDEETVARIFEPFFTTKEINKGTGLSLATVYGIVQQHKGHIAVQSTQGQGTVIEILFPIATPEQPILEDVPLTRDDGATILEDGPNKAS